MLQKLFLNKSGTAKLTIVDLLFVSCFFSCIMVIGRAAFTGLVTYAFLLWNLFLAFIPFAITSWLTRRPEMYKRKSILAVIIIAWLLFIPNSFYIITDLLHLDTVNSAPKWFDLLLIFSFA